MLNMFEMIKKENSLIELEKWYEALGNYGKLPNDDYINNESGKLREKFDELYDIHREKNRKQWVINMIKLLDIEKGKE